MAAEWRRSIEGGEPLDVEVFRRPTVDQRF
jgi:hypothetical protein